jgi:hypothetical protein
VTWRSLRGIGFGIDPSDAQAGQRIEAGDGTQFAFYVQSGNLYATEQLPSLAPDGNFETDPRANGYWSTAGNCSFAWTTADSHSPIHALQIGATTPGLCRWLTRVNTINAYPGVTYTASAWLKPTGVQGHAELSVDFWAADGTSLPSTVDSQRLSGTQSWTQVQLAAVAPRNAAYARVEVRLTDPGTLLADDVQLTAPPLPAQSTAVNVTAPVVSGTPQVGSTLTTSYGTWTGQPYDFAVQWLSCTSPAFVSDCAPIPGATGTTYTAFDAGVWLRSQVNQLGSPNPAGVSTAVGPVVLAPPTGGNLVLDGDVAFEPTPYFFSDGPCTGSWAADQAHSGSQSLKLVATTATLCRWMTRTQSIPATPATTYTVSAWVQTQGVGQGATLAVDFWNAAGAYIPGTILAPTSLRGTTGWTQISFQVTAPAGTAHLRLEGRLNGPGTAWLDDLSVVGP